MLSVLYICGVISASVIYGLILVPPVTTRLRRAYLKVHPLTLETSRRFHNALLYAFVLTIPTILFAADDVRLLSSSMSISSKVWQFFQRYLTMFGYIFAPTLNNMIRPQAAGPLDIHDVCSIVLILAPLFINDFWPQLGVLYGPTFSSPYLCDDFSAVQLSAASLVILIFGVLRPLPDTGLATDFRAPKLQHLLLLLVAALVVLPVPLIALWTDTFSFASNIRNVPEFLIAIPYLFLTRAVPLELLFRAALLNLLCAKSEVCVHTSAFVATQRYVPPAQRSLGRDSEGLRADPYLHAGLPLGPLQPLHAHAADHHPDYHSFSASPKPRSSPSPSPPLFAIRMNTLGTPRVAGDGEGMRTPLLSPQLSLAANASATAEGGYRSPMYTDVGADPDRFPRLRSFDTDPVQASGGARSGGAGGSDGSGGSATSSASASAPESHRDAHMAIHVPGTPKPAPSSDNLAVSTLPLPPSSSSLGVVSTFAHEAGVAGVEDVTWQLGDGFVGELTLLQHAAHRIVAAEEDEEEDAEEWAEADVEPSEGVAPTQGPLASSAYYSLNANPNDAVAVSVPEGKDAKAQRKALRRARHEAQRRHEARVRELDSPVWSRSRPEAPTEFDLLGTHSRWSYFLSRCCLPCYRACPMFTCLPRGMHKFLLVPSDWLYITISALFYAAYITSRFWTGDTESSDVTAVFFSVALAGAAAGFAWRLTGQVWVGAVLTWALMMFAEFGIDLK